MLGYLAHKADIFPGEHAVSSWLQAVDSSVFHATMRGLSFLSSTVPAIVVLSVTVIMLVVFRRRLEAFFIVSITASGTLLGQLLKWLIDRPRPGGQGGLSFPSGHTLYAMVFFGSLFYLVPRFIKHKPAIAVVRSALALLILLTGASRVHLGAHWPSDVLGSFILGGLLISSAVFALSAFYRPLD